MREFPNQPFQWILGVVFLILLANPHIGQAENPPEKESPEKYNIVFIDVTCLRADHLQSYGYKRKTSPFLDHLANEDIFFKKAVSQAYWTLPSVASIFTSKYPSTHNVLSRDQQLDDTNITIAEVLKDNGYKTAAFVGGLDLDSIHNLDQGFDIYYKETGEKPTGSFSVTIPKAVNWLEANKRNKFFLYIHGYDAHPPFERTQPFVPDYQGVIAGKPLDYQFLKSINKNKVLINGKEVNLNDTDLDYIITHYDSAITHVDNLISEFFKEMSRLKLLNKTIIVILGDHGEELSDHGSFDRFGKQNLYDEVVHVPLLIRHPKIKGVKIDQPVELIDIAPTVLGFLELPPVQDMQGRNLLPLIRDEIPQDPQKFTFAGWDNKQMIRSAQWKLIFNGADFELYDLKTDPKETQDQSKLNPQITATLSAKLFDWFVMTRFKEETKELVIPQNELPQYYQRNRLHASE